MSQVSDAQRLREAESEVRDAAETFTFCCFCPDWTYFGTAGAGREAALEHRQQDHPERVKPRRKSPPHLARFKQPVLDPEERALIEFERQRRARVNGVNLSSGS